MIPYIIRVQLIIVVFFAVQGRASSLEEDQISNLEQAILFNPFPEDPLKWTRALEAINKDKIGPGVREQQRFEKLKDQVVGLKNLADCLGKDQKTDVALRLARSGSISMSLAGKNCDLNFNRASQKVKNFSTNLSEGTFTDLALFRINENAVRRADEIATTFGLKGVSQDPKKLFEILCNWKTAVKSRGPLCANVEGAFQQFEKWKQNQATKTKSELEIKMDLRSAINTLAQEARQASETSYLRELSLQVRDPAKVVLIFDPVKSSSRILDFSSVTELNQNGPVYPENLSMKSLEAAADKAISSVLGTAATANLLGEKIYGQAGFKIGQFVGLYPEVFGEILMTHPESSGIICKAVKDFNSNREWQESAMKQVTQSANALGLGTGVVAIASCASTAFFPIAAIPCGVSSIASGALNSVNMLEQVANFAKAQEHVNEITMSWALGENLDDPNDIIEARKIVADSLSELAKAGALTVAGPLGSGVAKLVQSKQINLAVFEKIGTLSEKILTSLASKLSKLELLAIAKLALSLENGVQVQKFFQFLESAKSDSKAMARLKQFLSEVDADAKLCGI